MAIGFEKIFTQFAYISIDEVFFIVYVMLIRNAGKALKKQGMHHELHHEFRHKK